MIREGKKLPTGSQAKIPELVQAMVDDQDVIALYVFGSLVHGELKPLSDLDFAILLSNRLDKNQRFDKHIQLIGVFTDIFRTDEIDLINMNDAPPMMAIQILKTGKLMACTDKPTLSNFYERTIKTCLDFKQSRDAFDAVFLKGVGYHG